MNNDFFDKLPGLVIDVLNDIVMKYADEPWFEQAWEEYRQHILTTDMDHMRMPWFIFGKYAEE